jgi:hypothetical protein
VGKETKQKQGKQAGNDTTAERTEVGKKIFQVPTPNRGITMPLINAKLAGKHHLVHPDQGGQSIPFLLG